MEPKATVFEFTSYEFKPLEKKVIFNYKTEFSDREPLFFTETLILPKVPNIKNVSKEVIDKLLQSLHIILGISYYKFHIAKKVTTPYVLSKQEADFWNIVYKKGLGEFFYKNNLDPKISPEFPFTKTIATKSYKLKATSSRCLVGIGGGKDSIVAAELLKEHGFSAQDGLASGWDITSFVIETGKPSELVNNIIEIIGAGELKIQRFLDPKVHDKHVYNGHIPISAIYAFLGVFTAVLYNYSYVIVGNEHSSNFGNITYKGLNVNHQWSKSYEFETLFQDYVKNNITPNVFYFSLLRPFYEIRIVKLFSKYKKYFPYFSSCNRNFVTRRSTQIPTQINADMDQRKSAPNPRESVALQDNAIWCGQCSKCVFVFILLSAYLPKKELVKIFGKNLYADETLLPLFKDILGFGSMKPFDCVGTFEEAQTALWLALRHAHILENVSMAIVRQLKKRAKYHSEVFQTTRENSVPEQFKFLGMESAYILGYGKEGKITKQYLKKYYPNIKIGIGDSALDKTYLEKQKNFDIAIKTPGIKKELVTIPYTTATNIFFSRLRQGYGGQAKVKGKNTIIGITGSKGKSTTASLIYHILKTARKDVQLLGNIGKPMLEVLTKSYKLKAKSYFVLELSSYQLDDIKFSPDIAVVTNLFQEHMDYHGNAKHYWQAKQNIINCQHKDNYFVYNPKDAESAKWLKNYQGQAIPFDKNPRQSNLIGQHNQSNIGAAVSVAKILNIPDAIIVKAVKEFKPLPHRLEFVGTFKGITFINDANAAIPEATIMAIEALKNVDTIFLGGTDRGYDFSQLEKTIKNYKIKNVVLFPDSGNRMLRQTKGLKILKTKSMKEAVAFAYQHTKKDGICLLSCASPSYSLWKNFEEKGDQFKFFVKKLGK